MIKEFRIRNLRSFPNDEKQKFTKIKPITVLLGKNSSGKSTFIRSFPLLRQSVEARTVGPILWYGNYVDFGAFEEAVNANSEKDKIYFDFNLNVKLNYSSYYNPFDYIDDGSYRKSHIDCSVNLGVSSQGGDTFLKEVDIGIYDYIYKFVFDSDSGCELIILNKTDDSVLFEIPLNYLKGQGVIPEIGYIKEFNRVVDKKRLKLRRWNDKYVEEYFSGILINSLRSFFYHSTSTNTILEGFKRIQYIEKKNLKKTLLRVFGDQKYFVEKFSKVSSKELSHIYSLIINKDICLLLKSINSSLDRSFKRVRYIAPLRATAERYYRYQDVQVDEIDHTGSNLAMLLKSWSSKEMRDFTKWTSENFNFQVRIEGKGLHYALKLKTEHDSREYNINDMGFGFSQLLPIIVSLWQETNRNKDGFGFSNKNEPIIFAIEQPELHLHPSYQRKLIEVFVKTIRIAKEKEININLIFETHSESMINAIGDQIFENIIANDDVSIVIFDKDEDGNTRINYSSFDEQGDLLNWPIGFFSGEV